MLRDYLNYLLKGLMNIEYDDIRSIKVLLGCKICNCLVW